MEFRELVAGGKRSLAGGNAVIAERIIAFRLFFSKAIKIPGSAAAFLVYSREQERCRLGNNREKMGRETCSGEKGIWSAAR